MSNIYTIKIYLRHFPTDRQQEKQRSNYFVTEISRAHNVSLRYVNPVRIRIEEPDRLIYGVGKLCVVSWRVLIISS